MNYCEYCQQEFKSVLTIIHFEIGEAIQEEFGPDADYDDRAVSARIKDVERLMEPPHCTN